MPRQLHDSSVPADAVAAPRVPSRSAALQPEHLYKAAGLLFLLALLFRFWDDLSWFLLIVYAAAILAVVLNAVIDRIPLRRGWAAGLFGLVALAGTGAALWFGIPALAHQLRGLTQQLPAFQAQLGGWGEWVRQQTGLNVRFFGESNNPGGLAGGLLSGVEGTQVLGRAQSVAEYLTLPILILFGGLFAVADPNQRLLEPLLRAVPRDHRLAARRILELLGFRLKGWVKGTLTSMLIIGVLTSVALYLIGVPYALLLGVFAGLAEIVPFFGPIAAGITATLVALMQDPTTGLWTALATLGIQQIESYIVTPMVMAKAVEVHPFVTLFAIVILGSLFGFLGILLALPLTILFWTLIQVLWVERAIDTDQDPIAPVVED